MIAELERLQRVDATRRVPEVGTTREGRLLDLLRTILVADEEDWSVCLNNELRSQAAALLGEIPTEIAATAENNLITLAMSVRTMRLKQNDYFTARRNGAKDYAATTAMPAARAAEKEVDALVISILAPGLALEGDPNDDSKRI